MMKCHKGLYLVNIKYRECLHIYIYIIYIYIYTHTHTHIYIYIYLCVCVFVQRTVYNWITLHCFMRRVVKSYVMTVRQN